MRDDVILASQHCSKIVQFKILGGDSLVIMDPKPVSFVRKSAVYSLISLFVWQPIWVYAEVAANALPVASSNWVNKGEASRVERLDANGMVMDVNVSDRVSLQWDSFNIGSSATVNFNQCGGVMCSDQRFYVTYFIKC